MKRGTVVHERYTIQALAGTGGMGSVYRAVDSEGQLVALKVLSGGRQRMDMRFTREARILMRLKHPGIVRCLDSGVTKEGARFLVMEWLDGIDVDTFLRTDTCTIHQGLELAENVARALGFAHAQNMVHRDVKPSNIFLPGGDVSTAKLLDFGVARWSDATSLTATGMQIGTPSYMAPEQIRGDSSVGPSADVFSLGCVLFKCLTGKMAFAGNNRVAVFYKILLNEVPRIADVADNVPEPVSDLLERMLAKQAEERYKDGNEVAEELARIRGELSDEASRRLRRVVEVPSALTSSERQLVSIVVVAPRASDGTVQRGTDGVTILLEDHSNSDESFSALRDLRARHESAGVSFDSLPNGSIIAVLDSRRTASDQAASAARCALDLHLALDNHPVAIATGRAESGQTYHRLDEIIDRAVAMLAADHRESALAAANQEAELFIDDMTAGLVETRFQVAGVPGQQVLVGESHKTDQPVLLGKRTPFVGRRREMATLSAILDECIDDDVARAVLITGPPGIGKSRLQREFLMAVEENYDDVEIWHGRGDPMRTGSPLEVIAQAIRDTADIREDEPLEDRRDKLRERVARSVAGNRVEQVAAFIGKLIRTPWASNDVQLQAANADARLMGDRVRQACEELLASDLRRHPVLMVLDDFQWCSRATAAWIDRVLRNLSEKPMMVAAFARPEVHESFPDLWSSHDPDEVHLRALSKRASQELVRAVLGRQFKSPRIAELVERADGNALYLEGLMRSAKAGLQKLPDSMLAMVHSRLNELPAEVRRALRAASVFGKRFWSGGVAALLGDARQTQDFLHSLLISELIDKASTSKFADQAEYRFRHDVIREAAYSMLTDEDRSTGHRLAGDWLEQAGEPDALVIAVHCERGGALDKAHSFFERAAAHACNNGDFESAIGLADRGANCGADGAPLGRLLAIQAQAHYWSGRLQMAAIHGEHAIAELPPGTGDWYEAIDMTSLARFRLGQAYEVERYARWLAPQPPDEGGDRHNDFEDEFDDDFDEFSDNLSDIHGGDRPMGLRVSRRRRESQWLAPPPPPDHDRMGWLRLGADLSGHLFRDGRVDMARALLGRVEREIGELEDTAPWVAARVLSARAIRATLTEGNPSAALRESLRAVALYHQAGDKRRACLETVNVGRAQIELGQFEAAAASLRSSLATAMGLAVDLLVDQAKLYTSVALSHNDAVDKAIVLAESCVENFEKRGNRRLAATTRIHLAHFYLRDENLQAAEESTKRALSTCSKTSPVHAHALATRATLLLASGRAVEALHSTVQAMTLMEKFGSVDEGEAHIRLVYAEALEATDQPAAARIAITQARNRLRHRAKLIDRPDWRRSFLHDVPQNTRTLELAKLWNQRSASDPNGA